MGPNMAPPCPFQKVYPSVVSKAEHKAEGRSEGQQRKAGELKRKPGCVQEEEQSCFLADQRKLSARRFHNQKYEYTARNQTVSSNSGNAGSLMAALDSTDVSQKWAL